MGYDFTTVTDRSQCGSSKWMDMKKKKPDVTPGVIPFSTADMEFRNAPELSQGLSEYARDTILGYTSPTDAYYDAVISWMKRRHGYEVKREWIATTPGVVPAIFSVVKACTEKGDGVIIMPPVYYPFRYSALMTGRRVVENPLIDNGGRYEIDFDGLEEKAKDPANKILVFCSPHNPVGRVWTREELERVMDICIRNDVFVVSDEIHHDLVLPGYRHIPMGALSEKIAMHCAVCTAPSKTFNIAGVQVSNIIIRDPEMMQKFFAVQMDCFSFFLNLFAYKACELAYNKCGAWLDELIGVLDTNRRFMEDFFARNLPEVKVYPLEATYLLWVDFRALGMTHRELEELMRRDAELFLDEGYIFGENGRGFERFNIACPTSVLADAMERLLKAVNARKALWAKEGKPRHTTLEKGGKLEDFQYDTPFRAGVDFAAEAAGKKTLLLFLRYYGCPICQLDLHRIKAHYGELAAKGGQVKVVLQSQPAGLAAQLKETDFPFEIICDPEQKLYRRYNIFPADDLLSAADAAVMAKAGEAAAQGFAHGAYEGDEGQLPAAFLVGEGLEVEYAKYGKTMADVPTLEEMKELLG